jgi:hypothetical protein
MSCCKQYYGGGKLQWGRLELGKVQDSQKNITFQTDHAVAQGLPSTDRQTTHTSPHHWLLGGNQISFKSIWWEKHTLSAVKFYLCPPCSLLYFPFLTFNELHWRPCVLPWIFPGRTQGLWGSSDHRLHPAANKSNRVGGEAACMGFTSTPFSVDT